MSTAILYLNIFYYAALYRLSNFTKHTSKMIDLYSKEGIPWLEKYASIGPV